MARTWQDELDEAWESLLETDWSSHKCLDKASWKFISRCVAAALSRYMLKELDPRTATWRGILRVKRLAELYDAIDALAQVGE